MTLCILQEKNSKFQPQKDPKSYYFRIRNFHEQNVHEQKNCEIIKGYKLSPMMAKTFAIAKKMHFCVRKLLQLKKGEVENTIFYKFLVPPTVTETSDKVLLPKRLKIRVIKEKQ